MRLMKYCDARAATAVASDGTYERRRPSLNADSYTKIPRANFVCVRVRVRTCACVRMRVHVRMRVNV